MSTKIIRRRSALNVASKEHMQAGLFRLYALAGLATGDAAPSPVCASEPFYAFADNFNRQVAPRWRLPRQFRISGHQIKWGVRGGYFHISVTGDNVRWTYSEATQEEVFAPSTTRHRYLYGGQHCEYTSIDVLNLIDGVLVHFSPNTVGFNREFEIESRQEALALARYKLTRMGRSPLHVDLTSARDHGSNYETYLRILSDNLYSEGAPATLQEVLEETRQRFLN